MEIVVAANHCPLDRLTKLCPIIGHLFDPGRTLRTGLKRPGKPVQSVREIAIIAERQKAGRNGVSGHLLGGGVRTTGYEEHGSQD